MASPASDRRTYDAWKPTPPPPRPKRRILGWLGLGIAGDRGAGASPGATSGPRSWRTVVSASGDATKRTPVFKLHGVQARLRYTVADPEGLGAPTAAIYVPEEGSDPELDGGRPEVTATRVGSDETRLESPAGRYYLYVNAANTHWSVVIQEYR